jgi:hypothetical protein
MSLTKMALLAGVAGLLTACAGLDDYPQDSPHYRYSSGWALQLNRALEIGPDEASVRLQRGRIVPRNSVQEQQPFCVFELTTVGGEPQTVAPGRFEIWQVQRRVSTIADAGAPAAPVTVGYLTMGLDTPSFMYYKTEFRLRAASHPNVRSLTCMHDQLGPGGYGLMRHLTLDEIRYTLGDWFTLVPPSENRL